MANKIIPEATKQKIRAWREKNCFPIVDRGGFMASLTPTRKEEVLKWYKACLDATETGIIPQKPSWIK